MTEAMNIVEARGHWALITGASAGIGREFAKQLAAAGVHCILVARRKERLQALADELMAKHNVRCIVEAIDLSTPEASVAIRRRLSAEGVRVRLLINNAAFGRYGRFEGTKIDKYEEMIRLNISVMVSLCHAFLGDLSSFPSSAIINVSSQGAYNPVPFLGVYAATKAFVSSFSQALYEEWKDFNVHVQTLIPGPSDTDFDGDAGAYASVFQKRSPAAVAVSASLKGLGQDQPVIVTAKGILRQRLFSAIAPAKTVTRVIGRMFRPPDLDRDDSALRR